MMVVWQLLYDTETYSSRQWCLMREEWGSAYILVVLHLSMAFHIIGHGIILGWLWEFELGGSFALSTPWLLSISVDREWEVQSTNTLCGMLWSLYSLHSFLTSIQDQLGEIICQYGMWYQLCADDTQLYISISGDMSDAVTALSQCLEVVGIWMGTTGFIWMLVKSRGNGCVRLQVCVALESRSLSSLVLNGVSLSRTDLVHNVGILLDSQLLLKEQLN